MPTSATCLQPDRSSLMLEAQKLAARRGFSRLFTGSRFASAPGEALVVTGANGSGKTTLLRMLAGLSRPHAGEIRWHGKRVGPFDPRAPRGGRLRRPPARAQGRAHAPRRTSPRSSRSPAPTRSREAIGDALDASRLSRQRALPARVLSQGQRRRIGLARLSLVCAAAVDPRRAADRARRRRRRAPRRDSLGQPSRDGGLAVVATHPPLGLRGSRVAALALD